MLFFSHKSQNYSIDNRGIRAAFPILTGLDKLFYLISCADLYRFSSLKEDASAEASGRHLLTYNSRKPRKTISADVAEWSSSF